MDLLKLGVSDRLLNCEEIASERSHWKREDFYGNLKMRLLRTVNAFIRRFQFGELNMDVTTKRKNIEKWPRNPGKIVIKHNHGSMACTDVQIKNMLLENRKSGALNIQTT